MTKHPIQELSFEDFINNYESIDSVKSSEKLKREVTKILDEVIVKDLLITNIIVSYVIRKYVKHVS